MRKTVKRSLFALALALLLAGCSTAPAGEVLTPPTLAPGDSAAPEPVDAVLVDQAPWFATFRVVAGAETGDLVLAANGGSAGEVYTLNTEGLSLDRPVENGELINVYYETVMETYPARFGGVTAVEHTQTERDDRCGLYLQVLEDLWEVDSGLNTDLEELALDLSGLTDLSESEKDALVWQFGNAHGLMPVTATWGELVEEGYIDGDALAWNGRGCLFTLAGSAEEGFSAEKWASGLGAYFFQDCTAQKAADGTWSYEVGAHAIA